jgi:hypothetical protein
LYSDKYHYVDVDKEDDIGGTWNMEKGNAYKMYVRNLSSKGLLERPRSVQGDTV